MIFIPHNTPSLKNSKVKTSKGIFPSKTVTKYLRSLGIQSFSSRQKSVKGYKDPSRPNIFKQVFEEAGWVKPQGQLLLGVHFVRSSKRSFDIINAQQIIFDLMTAHDFIEDDDAAHIVPFPLLIDEQYYSYDKEKPGCYLKIIDIIQTKYERIK